MVCHQITKFTRISKKGVNRAEMKHLYGSAYRLRRKANRRQAKTRLRRSRKTSRPVQPGMLPIGFLKLTSRAQAFICDHGLMQPRHSYRAPPIRPTNQPPQPTPSTNPLLDGFIWIYLDLCGFICYEFFIF